MITTEDVLNQATQAAIADLTTPPDPALSAQEREQLAICEATIAAEQRSFYVLGAAIRQVRDARLYREQFDSIEAYGESRWDLKRAYLYQHIEAANVGDNLRAVTDVLPVNEFQTRQLSPLGLRGSAPGLAERHRERQGRDHHRCHANIAALIKETAA